MADPSACTASFAVQWFPLLYVGTNVIYLILAVPLGRLADRWGRVRVFLSGHVALLACYLLAAAPFGGLGITIACLMLPGLFDAPGGGPVGAQKCPNPGIVVATE